MSQLKQNISVKKSISAEKEQLSAQKKRIKNFIDEFSKESNRASVVLCAAKLDYLLYQILTTYLLPNTGSQDELLGSDRALGTFSARINISYRLGLIDADLARALHLFRKLRNAFAHEVSGSSFSHGPHQDWIREIIAPLAKYDDYHDFKKAIFKNKTEIEADFYSGASILVARLEALQSKISKINPIIKHSFIPPSWRNKKED